MTPPSRSSVAKYPGFLVASLEIRKSVTGTPDFLSSAIASGLFVTPSSMVMNATGCLVGTRCRSGAVGPAGRSGRTATGLGLNLGSGTPAGPGRGLAAGAVGSGAGGNGPPCSGSREDGWPVGSGASRVGDGSAVGLGDGLPTSPAVTGDAESDRWRGSAHAVTNETATSAATIILAPASRRAVLLPCCPVPNRICTPLARLGLSEQNGR